ncbi:MAG TPA: NAD(P)-dependent oxidoreductase [Candidatus Saccharimonadales bacterium]|nr:NAD(P)-dependent oxidoreductase [Candidatus Saccharimonadales bacterium]
MTHIAIFGANHDDRTFFTQHLKGHELAFYDSPVVAAKLNPRAEVVSTFIDTAITPEILDALPKLRLIACRSTGYNNVDIEAAKKRGITVANVPSYGGTTVAEYTFTLLLMLTRRMVEVLRESGTAAPDRERERGTDLFGKTIGIIGTGSIGLGVARIARGFGMEVLGYDVYPRPEEARKLGFTYCDDVSELLQKSDVVTLHVPYTPENHHFLRKEHINKLRHGAIVINTARGELVDTPALVDALRHGHIAGAALDVLEGEYLMDPDKLIALAAHDDAAKQTLRHAVAMAALQHMPNVILTDHNAYNTTEALQRINQTTADNILNFLDGKEVFTV